MDFRQYCNSKNLDLPKAVVFSISISLLKQYPELEDFIHNDNLEFTEEDKFNLFKELTVYSPSDNTYIPKINAYDITSKIFTQTEIKILKKCFNTFTTLLIHNGISSDGLGHVNNKLSYSIYSNNKQNEFKVFIQTLDTVKENYLLDNVNAIMLMANAVVKYYERTAFATKLISYFESLTFNSICDEIFDDKGQFDSIVVDNAIIQESFNTLKN